MTMLPLMLTVGLLGSSTTDTLRGWGRVTWGMTVEQARTALGVGDVAAYDVPEGFAFKAPAGIIAGSLFTATLVFSRQSKTLQRVLLTPLKNDEVGLLERVAELLTAQYGSPSVQKSEQPDLVDYRTTWVQWMLQSTTISAFEHCRARKSCLLILEYHPRGTKATIGPP